MPGQAQDSASIFDINVQLATITLAFMVMFAATILAPPLAQAQTFTVLQTFNNRDGNLPGRPILDRAGNIYGSTEEGGTGDYGSVYKLGHAGSGWVLDELYNFSTAAYPEGGPTFGPDGALYGTAADAIYSLRPPATFCRSITCPWNLTLLYSFQGGNDGSGPNGNVVFDLAGNMYGTTYYGGEHDLGTVWKATRSGDTWTETVLYSFDGPHGSSPESSVILDSAGNLYGTTNSGGANNWGAVYELSPAGSGWTEQLLYSLQNRDDGRSPVGGLVFDSAGNLYGSAGNNGQGFGGTVFELSPSNGGWTFNLLYSLSGAMGPMDSLTFDSAGNLYGTTYADGANGVGSVFELSPSGSGWSYRDLHDFTGGNDGKLPTGSVAFDADGNLFGTTSEGGTSSSGVIFEITP